MDQEIKVVPKKDDAAPPPSGELAPLSSLKDYMIADPLPDIRGWMVTLPDGWKVGKVDDLLVDTDALAVRYIEVKVDHHALGTDEDTWMLVPIGAARVDDENDVIIVDRLPKAGLAEAPRFARGLPSREQERALSDYYGPSTRDAGGRGERLFDQRRFWGGRRQGKEAPAYLTRGGGRPERASPPADDEIIVDAVIIEEGVVFVEEPGDSEIDRRTGEPNRPGGPEAR
jgi:hypothetical protein